MTIKDDDTPPESHAVRNSWETYANDLLPAISEVALTPASRGLCEASFFYGALSMLNIVQAVLEDARSQGATEIAFDGLRAEVEAVLDGDDDDGETLN